MVYNLVFVPKTSFTLCFKNLSLDMHDLKEARIGKGEVVWYHGNSPLIIVLIHYLFIINQFRLITLNGMKASEELTDEQSRQVLSIYILFLTFF